jgi:hypothetical protein
LNNILEQKLDEEKEEKCLFDDDLVGAEIWK